MSRRHYHVDPRAYDRMRHWPYLGADEVGTGALAGPICAAGVILPNDNTIREALYDAGLRDSKEMTGLTRARLYDDIVKHAVWFHVAYAWCWEIEDLGQSAAIDKVFTEVLTRCFSDYGKPESITIDGAQRPGVPYTYEALHKGDQKSLTISAASVVAKVTRDRLMVKMEEEYPGYDFRNNVGYGTAAHKQRLNELGPCEIHRRNTKPVKRAGGLKVPGKTFAQGWG